MRKKTLLQLCLLFCWSLSLLSPDDFVAIDKLPENSEANKTEPLATSADLSDAWQMLMSELTEQDADLALLSKQLDESRTEVIELKACLTASEQRLSSLELSLATEKGEKTAMQKELWGWRLMTLAVVLLTTAAAIIAFL